MYEKTQRLQTIARHYEKAKWAHHRGEHLNGSRWEELARYEQERLRKDLLGHASDD